MILITSGYCGSCAITMYILVMTVCYKQIEKPQRQQLVSDAIQHSKCRAKENEWKRKSSSKRRWLYMHRIWKWITHRLEPEISLKGIIMLKGWRHDKGQPPKPSQ